MALYSRDHEPLLTTAEAAQLCGVNPGTVRQWVNRGHLTPVGRLPAGGELMFRQIDVARAEARTRRHARRDITLRAA